MLMARIIPEGLILVVERVKCDYDGAELPTAEKCARLPVIRVTARAPEPSGTHSLCLIFGAGTWANPTAVGAFCMRKRDDSVAFCSA